MEGQSWKSTADFVLTIHYLFAGVFVFQPQSADYYQYDSGSEVDWGIRGKWRLLFLLVFIKPFFLHWLGFLSFPAEYKVSGLL